MVCGWGWEHAQSWHSGKPSCSIFDLTANIQARCVIQIQPSSHGPFASARGTGENRQIAPLGGTGGAGDTSLVPGCAHLKEPRTHSIVLSGGQCWTQGLQRPTESHHRSTPAWSSWRCVLGLGQCAQYRPTDSGSQSGQDSCLRMHFWQPGAGPTAVHGSPLHPCAFR
jgi:hypothetical protein